MKVSFAVLQGRIALLGGSFDPIHTGHIELAKLAKTKLALDHVVFIPAKHNPLRENGPTASDADRLEMLRLALIDQNGFEYSDIETQLNTEFSYSVDTLRKIRAENKDKSIQLFFIFGTDQIEKLHLWKEYKELFKLARLIVVGRQGIKAEDFAKLNANLNTEEIKILSTNFLEFDFPISSSQIREYLNKGDLKSVRKFLPVGVFDWIIQNNLYQ